MKKKINLDDVQMKPRDDGDFGFKRASLTESTGAKQLSCAVFELVPGKKAFPFHAHHSNEEAVFILEGEGRLRLGEEVLRVTKGDYIPFPVGKEYAHQLLNDSANPLRYLAFSTFSEVEIVDYPDSNKIGVFAGLTPGASPRNAKLAQFLDLGGTKGYYEGER